MKKLEKFTMPFDTSTKEEYGTQWTANLESEIQTFFQTSSDKEHPKWVRLGEMVESIYRRDETYKIINIDEIVGIFNKINEKSS